jgi:NEDD8-activating enzyme E1
MINGKNKTLYMSTVASIEERTRDNLNKTLFELGIVEDAEVIVADVTSPNTITLKIKYKQCENEVEMM